MDQTLPQLQEGDSGLAVQVAQRLLIFWNISVGPSGVDGQFGPTTLSGVQNFQQTYGLEPDGIIGPQTWAKLSVLASPG